MTDRPLVSVVVIFLNEARFLAEAIDSVFAQTCDSWELLLVDDGSTDGSSTIARSYAERQPANVRYLEHKGHENRGMSASRNLGLSHATGRYVSYLDGDDVWLPGKLERQLALLATHPDAVMVFGPILCWYSWNPDDTRHDHLYGLEDDGVRLSANQLIEPPRLLTYFLRHEALIPSGVMVERTTLERVGGHEEAFRGSFEDAVAHVKICLTSTAYVSDECWYRYRIHPQSCERAMTRSRHAREAQLTYLRWTEAYLARQEVDDPEVSRALADAFWPHRHPYLDAITRGHRRLVNGVESVIKVVGRTVLPASSRRRLWGVRNRYRLRSLSDD